MVQVYTRRNLYKVLQVCLIFSHLHELPLHRAVPARTEKGAHLTLETKLVVSKTASIDSSIQVSTL